MADPPNQANEDEVIKGDVAFRTVLRSLLKIPAVFEDTGSSEDLILAQASRQNAKATMQLPLNAVEWAGLILKCAGGVFGSAMGRSAVFEALTRCTTKYDQSIDAQA